MKTLRRLLVAATTAALLLSTTIMTVAAATPDSVGLQSEQTLQKVGTSRIAGAHPVASASFSLKQEIGHGPDSAGGGGNVHGGHVSAAALPTSAPSPAPQKVVDATGTPHVPGLSHFDQRYAGSGTFFNTQVSLEPPDQGLCAGNGFVVETVNLAVRVRDSAGNILADATPLNQLFGLLPSFDRNTGLNGQFTSDPKCYYDAPTHRWFLTMLEIDQDPVTAAFTGGSHLLIAVTASSNPTGSWNLFSIDTTHDGSHGGPRHKNCPCYGDQPLIGADKYGFYVTTNEFPLFTPGFNGDMVYAMSKAALASGAGGKVTTFFQTTLAEGQAYTMEPATTPAGAAFAMENGGSEYFLSTLEFTGGLDNRIALWSMTNTSSLGSAHPKVKMHLKIVTTETYGMPPVMAQRSGPTPLRSFLNTNAGAAFLGITKVHEPRSPLNSNGDAMQQTVYVNGQIWGSLSTIVSSAHSPDRVGVAYFAVKPSAEEKLDGQVTAQGYVSVNRNHLGFPAIAANAAGKVLIAFGLVGPSYYPSAAYSWIDAKKGAGDVRVVSWGVGPADGFTGYLSLDPQDNGIERWGDYSAATTDEAGNFWFATETINQSCSLHDFVASNFWCGGSRTILANWGTTIAKVHP